MSKIVIIGAGAMGTAFAFPCLDNNHDINIVGTHLENDFIDQLNKNNRLHPGLNTEIPQGINILKFDQFDAIFKRNVDLIVFAEILGLLLRMLETKLLHWILFWLVWYSLVLHDHILLAVLATKN